MHVIVYYSTESETVNLITAFQVLLPEEFNFSNPNSWPGWIRRFECFRQASGLEMKKLESQVNTLIYTMGIKADDILSSFGLSEDD